MLVLFVSSFMAIFATVLFPVHLRDNDMSNTLIAFTFEFALMTHLVTAIALQSCVRSCTKPYILIILGLLMFIISPILMAPAEGIN